MCDFEQLQLKRLHSRSSELQKAKQASSGTTEERFPKLRNLTKAFIRSARGIKMSVSPNFTSAVCHRYTIASPCIYGSSGNILRHCKRHPAHFLCVLWYYCISEFHISHF